MKYKQVSTRGQRIRNQCTLTPVQNNHAWHLISLQKMDIGKKYHTSFKSRTTDVGAMVSMRISYISNESLCESQIMTIWQSFYFSLEFPRTLLQTPSQFHLFLTARWPQQLLCRGYQRWPSPTPFTFLLPTSKTLLPSFSSSPFPSVTSPLVWILCLCSTGCFPLIYWYVEIQTTQHSVQCNSWVPPVSLLHL